MPLDPIFSQRLAVHRRYLIGQAIERLKDLFSWRRPSRIRRPDSTDVAAAEVTRTASGGLSSVPGTPRLLRSGKATPKRRKTRAQHRKAALAWDKKELETVGLPGPRLRTVEHTVPVPNWPDVRVRIYYPEEASPSAAAVPACIAFFGGAFRIGGIDYPTTDAAFRHRAHDAEVAIVAVDYALAPEHRYPTQVEQAHAALVWVFGHAAELGIDRERIGIAGTSAGANIAAVVTLMNRERSRLPIRLQLLEVPVTDLTGGHIDLRATRALGIPSIIAVRELRSVARTYLPRREQAKEQHASPLLASSHAGLPPAYILTAEYDPLRGDGAAYAAALRAAGVDASAVQYLGSTHDASVFMAVLPAARRWHADVISVLRRLHE